MLKGQDASHIVFGNSFSRGRPRRARTFDYLLANPPFGVEWKKVETDDPRRARAAAASAAASAPGCRASTTARFLFLQHMISQDEAGRARAARGSRSSSTARRSSPAPPARASRRSAAGSSRTTGSRPSSRCPTSSSTTPASRPTSGSSPTARRRSDAARCSSSTPASYWVKMRKSLGEKRKEISRRADRRDHAPLRRLRGGRAGQDLPQRGSSASCGSPSSGRCGCATPPTEHAAPDGRASKAYAKLKADAQERGRCRRLRLGAATTRARSSRSRRAHATASPKPEREGAAGRARRPRRRGAAAKGEPEPDPELRDQENVPLPASPWRSRPIRRARSRASRTARAVDEYLERRGAALRPRRLGRPRQDEDRLRDPAHPALLPLRAAAAARRDRRRDPGAGGGDPGVLGEVATDCARPSSTPLADRVSNVDKKSIEGEMPVRL